MLTRITIEGFKSIRELKDLELRPLNVLIGPNGAGKSNFVSFFRMLRSWVTPPGELQIYVAKCGGVSAVLFDGPGRTQQIKSTLTFGTSKYLGCYHTGFLIAANDSLLFQNGELEVDLIGDSGHSRKWGVTQTPRESPFDTVQLRDDAYVWATGFLRGIRTYQFHNTTETARIRQKCDAEDNKPLKEDAGNLAAVLHRLKVNEPRSYSLIANTVRQVVPFFADFHLEPDYGKLLLRWRELGSDVIFGSHQASDGTLRSMALITLLMQPKLDLPAVMILDEPELGLHPAAIALIAGLIRSASLHSQIILATQSPTLLNHFDPEDVIVVERHGRESIFKRLDPDKLQSWLEDYSLGELWEKNVIGGRPGR